MRSHSSRTLTALALLGAASSPFTGVGALEAQGLAQADGRSNLRTIEVVVDGGFHPARIEVEAGERVRLLFVRREYGPCTHEVVFPSLEIRRELPTNERVAVDLPVLAPGEYEFRCGMNMIHGKLVVTQARP